MGQLQINISGQKRPPTVSNNYVNLNSQSYTFKTSDFLKDFIDPEQGIYSDITLVSLPTVTTLTYLGSAVQVNSVINANNIYNLKLDLDPKYAIHNGVLYEFSKNIDLIIADHEALGYKLIYNISGLLAFAKSTDISDIVVIKGTAIDQRYLNIEFTIQANPSGLQSNIATFSLIPWENVNLKQNHLITGEGGIGTDGLSAYEIAVNNGFVGTEQEWLDSLIGPAGADGTSVTIKGSYATPEELPVTGTDGDGYLIGGYLYVWVNGTWQNVGLIRGPKGDPGIQGLPGTGIEYIWDGTQLGIRYEGETTYTYQELKGPQGDIGPEGPVGPSAYQVWLNLGNVGTEADFIASLTGPAGQDGVDGVTPIKGVDYFDGIDGINGTDGNNGLSAYQVWLNLGNAGSQQDFINSLTGPEGPQGNPGPPGLDAKFIHRIYSFDYIEGTPQIFNVPDATLVTGVRVKGLHLEKNNPDGTSDEWKILSPTEIEIIDGAVDLEDGDRVTIDASTEKIVDGVTKEAIGDALGYIPDEPLKQVDISITNPEILQSNTTPVTLLMARSKGIEVQSIRVKYIFNGISYTDYLDGEIKFEGHSSPISLIDLGYSNLPDEYIPVRVATVGGAALIFKTADGNPLTGDGALQLTIKYKEMTVDITNSILNNYIERVLSDGGDIKATTSTSSLIGNLINIE